MEDVVNATFGYIPEQPRKYRIIPLELAMKVAGGDRTEFAMHVAESGCHVATYHGEQYLAVYHLDSWAQIYE